MLVGDFPVPFSVSSFHSIKVSYKLLLVQARGQVINQVYLSKDDPSAFIWATANSVGCLQHLPLMGEATSGGQEDGVVVGSVVKANQCNSRGICKQEPVPAIKALV